METRAIPTQVEHRQRDTDCVVIWTERVDPADFAAGDTELRLIGRQWDEGKSPADRVSGGKTRLEDSQAREAALKALIVRLSPGRQVGELEQPERGR